MPNIAYYDWYLILKYNISLLRRITRTPAFSSHLYMNIDFWNILQYISLLCYYFILFDNKIPFYLYIYKVVDKKIVHPSFNE